MATVWCGFERGQLTHRQQDKAYKPKKCAVEAGCICATCVRNETEKAYRRCCYQDEHMCLICPNDEDLQDPNYKQSCPDYIKAEEANKCSECR